MQTLSELLKSMANPSGDDTIEYPGAPLRLEEPEEIIDNNVVQAVRKPAATPPPATPILDPIPKTPTDIPVNIQPNLPTPPPAAPSIRKKSDEYNDLLTQYNNYQTKLKELIDTPDNSDDKLQKLIQQKDDANRAALASSGFDKVLAGMATKAGGQMKPDSYAEKLAFHQGNINEQISAIQNESNLKKEKLKTLLAATKDARLALAEKEKLENAENKPLSEYQQQSLKLQEGFLKARLDDQIRQDRQFNTNMDFKREQEQRREKQFTFKEDQDEKSRRTKVVDSYNKDKVVQTATQALAQADKADSIIRDGGPLSASVMGRILARMAGEVGVMTDKDVESFKGSPKWTDSLNRLYTKGTQGKLTKEDASAMSQMVKKLKEVEQSHLQQRANVISGQYSAINTDYTPEQIITWLEPAYKQQLEKVKPATNERDQQAIEWAKKNKDNPKAQQILKMHGVQ